MKESVMKIVEQEETVLSSIEEILVDVRAGKPVIMIDDERRENEGDLIVAADKITPQIINFMIRECGGFVCLQICSEIMQRLELKIQERRNVDDIQAPFTVSIEAAQGVTTGVSVDDRYVTIKTAVNPDASANDIATPGHIFPLLARDGGVLERKGHTEATADLSELAGFTRAGVLCEVMNEDGSMARLPELTVFAKKHGLKIGSIEDLITYRKNHG